MVIIRSNAKKKFYLAKKVNSFSLLVANAIKQVAAVNVDNGAESLIILRIEEFLKLIFSAVQLLR